MKTRIITVKTAKRRIPITKSTCPECTTRFEGHPFRVYCGPKCKRRAEWKRVSDQRNATRRERYREAKGTA